MLNYGSLNYDYVYHVDHIVKPGETLHTIELKEYLGGKGLNQSIALARAGVPVIHVGHVGPDGGGALDLCKKEGIDASRVDTVNVQTGHAIIQIDKAGENSIVVFAGANGCNTQEKVHRTLDILQKGDILLLQNEINLLEDIVSLARAKGITMVLNPSPFNEKITGTILSSVDILVFNATEGESITGKKLPMDMIFELKKRYPQMRGILTQGKVGVTYFDQDRILCVNAYQVKSLDTTAAGDTFAGYFVAGLYQQLDMKQALETACAAAALATTVAGASPSIPTQAEVQRFRKTYFR